MAEPLLSGREQFFATTTGSPVSSKRRARSFSSQRMCWLASAKNATFCGRVARSALEQPLDHGAEQFLCLPNHRRRDSRR